MVGIFLFLLFSFLLFFVLTRKIWLKVKKDDIFKVEIHFPIIALVLFKRKSEKHENARIKRGPRAKFSLSQYPRIISVIFDLSRQSELEINRIALQTTDDVAKIYKYHTAIYTFIAYVRTKAKKITIPDDAIILSPDVKNFAIEFTLKTELFRLLRSYIKFTLKREKYKKVKNVGK